jgi:drug/metabolite transporter (DMT)-like permease
MAILLAIGSAAGWGAADFFGGANRQQTPVLVIVAVVELIGLAMVAPVLLARGVPVPQNPRLLLACVAGVGTTLELGLIYLALSRGEAFITASVGGLGAAVAVSVGLIGGDPLNPAIAAGLAGALLGGGVSAWTSATGGRARGDTLRSAFTCAGAATGVAVMLISFHAAGRIDPYWATAAEHASTAVAAGLIAVALPGAPLRRRLPRRGQLPGLALVAATGVGGDLAYAVASRTGALSIVSAISSLYPLATVGLGLLLQGRRASRLQTAGIVIALAGAAVLGAAAR